METADGLKQSAAIGNRFDRAEWAGAFGDLGTLIPFVAAYIGVLHLDPLGILLAIGLAQIACGLVYRTPVPVQPMKAIGAAATTQTAHMLAVTPQAVYAAGLVTGVFWLLLGVSGLARHVARLAARPVVLGIVLGLGISFMVDGARAMSGNWWLAAPGLALTLLLLTSRAVPAMVLLLAYGAAVALVTQPALVDELGAMHPALRLPEWSLGALSWSDLAVGALVLALPQIPLTLGNAVIAVTEENNRLFPHRPVTARKLAISTGLINLFGAQVGGVPTCHGAGGMAGHVRFGARTGGAVVIIGVLVVLLALFFSGSIGTLFKFFPAPILGVILFLTGAQLALGSCDSGLGKRFRFVLYATAGLAVWNVGVAFVAGLAFHFAATRRWIEV